MAKGVLKSTNLPVHIHEERSGVFLINEVIHFQWDFVQMSKWQIGECVAT